MDEGLSLPGTGWIPAAVARSLALALADRQLAAFKADPRHARRTCRRGPRRYSRHPGDFFGWGPWGRIGFAAPQGEA
jgi:steroid 5-alpha reductase family enzyme